MTTNSTRVFDPYIKPSIHDLLWSKVASLELFTFKELFEVSPEYVANIDIMVSLIPLQLHLLHIPIVYLLWHLVACVGHVEASHSGKQFTLLAPTPPILELPVLPIHEHCHHSLPSSLCKVGHTIIDIKSDLLIVNLVSDLNRLDRRQGKLLFLSI